jgi:hypothetical protein
LSLKHARTHRSSRDWMPYENFNQRSEKRQPRQNYVNLRFESIMLHNRRHKQEILRV